MEILNLSQWSGYPHQLINRTSGDFQFVHNQDVSIGDHIKIIQNTKWMEYEITEIIESRQAKGNHKDPKAMWFNVKSVQVPLTDG